MHDFGRHRSGSERLTVLFWLELDESALESEVEFELELASAEADESPPPPRPRTSPAKPSQDILCGGWIKVDRLRRGEYCKVVKS
jgi:hypothetical protein